MSYDSRKDTKDHIEKVYQVILKFVVELGNRAIKHDASKLESPEKELFDKYTPLLSNTTYGSEQYKKYLKEMGAALQHHYENNRHHPEHFDAGIWDMALVDIIEMFCDWAAASARHSDGDFAASLKHNRGRFAIDDQLYAIFVNTAMEFGLLLDNESPAVEEE